MKKETILNMLDAQMKINSDIAGKEWIHGESKNNKSINWARAIYIETVELIDSYPWKHWKDIDKEPDYRNIKIELIDIWHFIMSLVIETVFKDYEEQLGQKISDKIDFAWEHAVKESVADFIIDVYNAEKESDFTSKIVDKKHLHEIDRQLSTYEELILTSILLSKIKDKDSSEERNTLVSTILGLFFEIIRKEVLLDLDSIYEGKRILNVFRQDHGYKNGHYIKEWLYNGEIVEDNVVMFDLLDKGSSDLYGDLKQIYSEVTRELVQG
jgi:hypothetical protein